MASDKRGLLRLIDWCVDDDFITAGFAANFPSGSLKMTLPYLAYEWMSRENRIAKIVQTAINTYFIKVKLGFINTRLCTLFCSIFSLYKLVNSTRLFLKIISMSIKNRII